MLRQTPSIRARLLQLPTTTTTSRTLTTTTVRLQGRDPKEHVTNQDHDLDIHSAASNSGQRDRHGGEQSGAASEKDKGAHNERAEKDHPEAPKPVIGMNDERGGKGH
ncbi:MAG: hypothetical protein M1833_001145 [Piccolia ochrophora]|nr:MAG: hypothetical protein M1833_001145 [Piccolia ochrophora]